MLFFRRISLLVLHGINLSRNGLELVGKVVHIVYRITMHLSHMLTGGDIFFSGLLVHRLRIVTNLIAEREIDNFLL